MKEPHETTIIGEKTFFSLHLVIITVCVVSWLIRLSDRLDVAEHAVEKIEKQLHKCVLEPKVRERRKFEIFDEY